MQALYQRKIHTMSNLHHVSMTLTLTFLIIILLIFLLRLIHSAVYHFLYYLKLADL